MAINSTHPLYDKMKADWIQLRDFNEGESAVKARGEIYLPSTKGMRLDGMRAGDLGREVYGAYLLRAVCPEYVSDALEIFMGMLHNKSAVIELPPELEELKENATALGEPLELLLQRINFEQLLTGRLGLLLDLPEEPDPAKPLPFIALYAAEAVRNWDANTSKPKEKPRINFVSLDESGYTMGADFTWTMTERYRLLKLEDGVYTCGQFGQGEGLVSTFTPESMFSPMIRGRKLDEIPFVFVNAQDISPSPSKPPLIPLARMCAAIYRGEADYRQNLFMQGQDTLVVVGDRKRSEADINGPEEPLRTGAGSRIDLEVGGTAEYIGVQSQGLPEQRYSIEADRKRAETRSGQLIDATRGDKESGTALKTRVGAQTASLNQIAKTGALALEIILRAAARWLQADESKVKVTPNLEFADYQMSGQDLVNLMTAKRANGAPLSSESIHRLMVQGNLTAFDYPTELAKIEEEPEFESPEMKLAKENAAARQQGSLSTTGPAPKDPGNPAPNND